MGVHGRTIEHLKVLSRFSMRKTLQHDNTFESQNEILDFSGIAILIIILKDKKKKNSYCGTLSSQTQRDELATNVVG